MARVQIGSALTPVPGGRSGPFKVGTSFYAVGYSSVGSPATSTLYMYKASDPTSSWTEVDSTHHPTLAFPLRGGAMNAIDCVLIGTKIYTCWAYLNGSNAVTQYVVFDTATDTWGTTQSLDTTASPAATCTCTGRSTGDVVFIWSGSGGYLTYKIVGPNPVGVTQNSAVSGWDGTGQIFAVTGSSDRVHIFGGAVHVSLSSANAFDTAASFASDQSGNHWLPICYNDSGIYRLRVLYLGTTPAAATPRLAKADSGANPTWTQETVGDAPAVSENPAIANDGTTLRATWSRASDRIIMRDYSANNGGSWTTDVADTNTGSSLSANVLVRGANYVLGFVYQDAGQFYYDDIFLRVATVIYPKTLVAGEVTASGSLVMHRGAVQALSASIVEGATLKKTAINTLRPTIAIPETAILTKIPPAQFFVVAVSEMSRVNTSRAKAFSASAAEAAALNHGAFNSRILALSETTSTSLSLIRGKTFAVVVGESTQTSVARTRGLRANATHVTPSLVLLPHFFRVFSAPALAITSSLVIVKAIHPGLSTGVPEKAQLLISKGGVIIATPMTISTSAKRAMIKNLAAITIETSTLVKHQVLSRALSIALSETASMLGIKARLLIKTATVSESVSISRRISKASLTIVTQELAFINKRGRYHPAPTVLQLYDLDDPYKLPTLKGATVAFTSNLFGTGVEFDIYAAYVAAGGAFYVCDNGLKQALDQHPAMVRVI